MYIVARFGFFVLHQRLLNLPEWLRSHLPRGMPRRSNCSCSIRTSTSIWTIAAQVQTSTSRQGSHGTVHTSECHSQTLGWDR